MRILFYILWLIALVYSLFVLAGGKIFSLGAKLIYEEDTGEIYQGELYRMCKIDKFKITPVEAALMETDGDSIIDDNYNYTLHTNTDKLDRAKYNVDSADVLFFGDSYIARVGGIEIASPGDSSDAMTIYNVSYDGLIRGGTNPLAELDRLNFQNDRPRILILETTERSSLRRALAYDKTDGVLNSAYLNRIIYYLFTNDHIEYFFTDNIFSYPIFKKINNIKFNYWGDIDNRIGAYSIQPKMLFYYQAVDFNKSNKSENKLERVAANIADLAENLKSRYNMHLIYVIVPNKYSIYGEYADSMYRYDNFIPELSARLAKLGVSTIDMYDLYMGYRQSDDSRLLYSPNDTHYSEFGKELFIKAVTSEILKIKAETESDN